MREVAILSPAPRIADSHNLRQKLHVLTKSFILYALNNYQTIVRDSIAVLICVVLFVLLITVIFKNSSYLIQ